MAGVSDVKRNAHVDLAFQDTALVILKGNSPKLTIPYEQIRRVQILQSGRYYEKSAVAADVAGEVFGVPGVGVLVMLIKDHVTSLVFDYVNERGGAYGLVVEVPQDQWPRCRDRLTRAGVTLEEPPPAIPPHAGGAPAEAQGQD